MIDAPAFPGVLDFFRRATRRGVTIAIVSHKTRHPFLGPPYDLHQAARDWLEKNGFFDPASINLARERVFLEPTREEKLSRISSLRCTHFIDDSAELLAEPRFPGRVERFLFDPRNECQRTIDLRRMGSWDKIEEELLAA